MKALILNGSGHSDGFTSAMCQSASDALTGKGIETLLVYLGTLSIKHCTGCLGCRKGRNCVIRDDDMPTIYDEMQNVDIVIMASPIRFSGPSSQIKTVMDRMNPYWYVKYPHPEYAAAMLCAGGNEPNFRNAVSEMKSMSNTVGMEWAGELEISRTDDMTVDQAASKARDFAIALADMMLK